MSENVSWYPVFIIAKFKNCAAERNTALGLKNVYGFQMVKLFWKQHTVSKFSGITVVYGISLTYQLSVISLVKVPMFSL